MKNLKKHFTSGCAHVLCAHPYVIFFISVIATFIVFFRNNCYTFSKMITQNNEDQPNIAESHNYSRDELGTLAKQNQNKQLFSILNINI